MPLLSPEVGRLRACLWGGLRLRGRGPASRQHRRAQGPQKRVACAQPQMYESDHRHADRLIEEEGVTSRQFIATYAVREPRKARRKEDDAADADGGEPPSGVGQPGVARWATPSAGVGQPSAGGGNPVQADGVGGVTNTIAKNAVMRWRAVAPRGSERWLHDTTFWAVVARTCSLPRVPRFI